MGKMKQIFEMHNYTTTQLLMSEKEDLIEYIEYLRSVISEAKGDKEHISDVERVVMYKIYKEEHYDPLATDNQPFEKWLECTCKGI